MESLRESIKEREKHKREYDRRMNDRMMQSIEAHADSSKALDDLVVTESSGAESERHVLSNRSGNENEKLNKENKHLKQTYKDLSDSIKKTSVHTKDHADSLIIQLNCKTVENADLKSQIQEKVFANASLKNELRKSKENSVDTKFAKPSILGKPVLQPPRNQSVVRQPNAFKSERLNFSKPRFASQVDVNNVLSKPVTPYYLPKFRESAPAKPQHVNAPSSSRNSQKESYGSNDIAHNYYLDEAKKRQKTKIGILNLGKCLLLKHTTLLMLVYQNLGAIIKHLGIGLHLRVIKVLSIKEEKYSALLEEDYELVICYLKKTDTGVVCLRDSIAYRKVMTFSNIQGWVRYLFTMYAGVGIINLTLELGSGSVIEFGSAGYKDAPAGWGLVLIDRVWF
nr:hypothetical protein [Tanacetum cinerariifolium]